MARDTRDNPPKPQYAIQKNCAGRAKREFPRSRKNNGRQSQCKAQNATSELNSNAIAQARGRENANCSIEENKSLMKYAMPSKSSMISQLND